MFRKKRYNIASSDISSSVTLVRSSAATSKELKEQRINLSSTISSSPKEQRSGPVTASADIKYVNAATALSPKEERNILATSAIDSKYVSAINAVSPKEQRSTPVTSTLDPQRLDAAERRNNSMQPPSDQQRLDVTDALYSHDEPGDLVPPAAQQQQQRLSATTTAPESRDRRDNDDVTSATDQQRISASNASEQRVPSAIELEKKSPSSSIETNDSNLESVRKAGSESSLFVQSPRSQLVADIPEPVEIVASSNRQASPVPLTKPKKAAPPPPIETNTESSVSNPASGVTQMGRPDIIQPAVAASKIETRESRNSNTKTEVTSLRQLKANKRSGGHASATSVLISNQSEARDQIFASSDATALPPVSGKTSGVLPDVVAVVKEPLIMINSLSDLVKIPPVEEVFGYQPVDQQRMSEIEEHDFADDYSNKYSTKYSSKYSTEYSNKSVEYPNSNRQIDSVPDLIPDRNLAANGNGKPVPAIRGNFASVSNGQKEGPTEKYTAEIMSSQSSPISGRAGFRIDPRGADKPVRETINNDYIKTTATESKRTSLNENNSSPRLTEEELFSNINNAPQSKASALSAQPKYLNVTVQSTNIITKTEVAKELAADPDNSEKPKYLNDKEQLANQISARQRETLATAKIFANFNETEKLEREATTNQPKTTATTDQFKSISSTEQPANLATKIYINGSTRSIFDDLDYPEEDDDDVIFEVRNDVAPMSGYKSSSVAGNSVTVAKREFDFEDSASEKRAVNASNHQPKSLPVDRARIETETSAESPRFERNEIETNAEIPPVPPIPTAPPRPKSILKSRNVASAKSPVESPGIETGSSSGSGSSVSASGSPSSAGATSREIKLTFLDELHNSMDTLEKKKQQQSAGAPRERLDSADYSRNDKTTSALASGGSPIARAVRPCVGEVAVNAAQYRSSPKMARFQQSPQTSQFAVASHANRCYLDSGDGHATKATSTPVTSATLFPIKGVTSSQITTSSRITSGSSSPIINATSSRMTSAESSPIISVTSSRISSVTSSPIVSASSSPMMQARSSRETCSPSTPITNSRDAASTTATLTRGKFTMRKASNIEQEEAAESATLALDALAVETHAYFTRKTEESPIVGRSGSFRGVKNKVKGDVDKYVIKMTSPDRKDYGKLDKGKISLYTTSVSAIRERKEQCDHARKILQWHRVYFYEKDIFVSGENHEELMDRLGQLPPDQRPPITGGEKFLDLPQIFIEDLYIGGLDELQVINENGVLKEIFKDFRKVEGEMTCGGCGGFRYTPCLKCHGSKKTVWSNFTISPLRCTACDENGLTRCPICSQDGDDDDDDDDVTNANDNDAPNSRRDDVRNGEVRNGGASNGGVEDYDVSASNPNANDRDYDTSL